jgi:hypothetical protein
MFRNLKYHIQLRWLQRKARRTHAFYRKLYRKAQKQNPPQGLDEISLEDRMETDLIDDDIAQLRSQYLIEQAEDYLIPVPEIERKGDAWEQSDISGRWRLTRKSAVRLLSAIRKEKTERFDYWQKRIGLLIGLLTLLLGILGTLIGLVSIWKK